MFPVLDVSTWVVARDESLGSKRKAWLIEPGANRLWLFKHLTTPEVGEDWAEKIASEVAAALHLPHATVELATLRGERGCVSLDLTEGRSQGDLLLGRSLMREVDPSYPDACTFRNVEHSVDRIHGVLSQPWIDVPPAVPAFITTPVELFAGYLLLDAVIGNVDRHHENWGVLVKASPDTRIATLAPTFDHASSLGRELLDRERSERLTTRDQNRTVAYYALRKARSALYLDATSTRQLTPVEAFQAFGAMVPSAARAWSDLLRQVRPNRLAGIVDDVPDTTMSPTAKRFARQFLEVTHTNLTRLPPP